MVKGHPLKKTELVLIHEKLQLIQFLISTNKKHKIIQYLPNKVMKQ